MNPLIQHIQKVTGSRETDELDILSYFDTQSFPKKAILQQEGKPCLSYFFVVKGCLRLFFLDDNGVEQTLQFALENWWMTDLDAFRSDKASGYSVQALEASEVMVINVHNYGLLLQRNSLMEKYFRLVYERAYAASVHRVRMISRMSKNEFYELFASTYPEFIQRIPQKILASFLGFTPEYLSQLRKNRPLKRRE